jgi:acyl-coenzyme A synthetase/AMP-(fatty) acid ligase
MKIWAKKRFAPYEYPRVVEFVKELPKGASGKILWRELQAKEFEGRRS